MKEKIYFNKLESKISFFNNKDLIDRQYIFIPLLWIRTLRNNNKLLQEDNSNNLQEESNKLLLNRNFKCGIGKCNTKRLIGYIWIYWRWWMILWRVRYIKQESEKLEEEYNNQLQEEESNKLEEGSEKLEEEYNNQLEKWNDKLKEESDRLKSEEYNKQLQKRLKFINLDKYILYICKKDDELIRLIIKGPIIPVGPLMINLNVDNPFLIMIKDKKIVKYIRYYIIYNVLDKFLEFHVVTKFRFDDRIIYNMCDQYVVLEMLTDPLIVNMLNGYLNNIKLLLRDGTYNNYIEYSYITRSKEKKIILKAKSIDKAIINNIDLDRLNVKLVLIKSNQELDNYRI